MADERDIELWKMEKAWELANRIIPTVQMTSGAFAHDNYLPRSQEVLTQAREVVETVFKRPSPQI